MHGVAKVALDEFQRRDEETKRKKKIEVYLNIRDKIFSKTQNGSFDLDGLRYTAELLSKNPDIYSLWNYRKRTLSKLKENHCPHTDYAENDQKKSSFDNLCKRELELTETCLQKNPKSYGAWHHRFWVISRCIDKINIDFKCEVKRCDALLFLDGRNFHCWDYWRLLCNFFDVSTYDRLIYTKSKIDYNFSNYSAWHCRANLLLNDIKAKNYRQINVETYKFESKLVLEGIFTDVRDQSAFFYKIWLLNLIDSRRRDLSITKVDVEDDSLTIYFNDHVNIKSDSIVFRVGNDYRSNFDWKAEDGSRCFKIWTCKSNDALLMRDSDTFEINWLVQNRNLEFHMNRNRIITGSRDFVPVNEIGCTVTEELTANDELRECVRSELGILSQLVEMDPNEKWPLLIYTLALQKVDREVNKDRIISGLEKLKTIDPIRMRYYDYLRNDLGFLN
uniref:Geranylgeranyl transferase type-2 subunit alpha n=1 Tax=Romanomermis culicivorax TaxID=13658 RepID=A0A915HU24_ROMCU